MDQPDRVTQADAAPSRAPVQRQQDDGTSSPAPAPGAMVGWREAARILGVRLQDFSAWQKAGRVHGTRGMRYTTYSIKELQRLKEEIRRRTEPYPDPDRPGCFRIPLTSDPASRLEAIIDAESLPLVQGKEWNWYPGYDASRPGKVFLKIPGRPEKTALHQIIMGVRGPKFPVRHRNGDPLDCRRENLLVLGTASREAESGSAALARDVAARERRDWDIQANLPDPAATERPFASEPSARPQAFPRPGWVDVDGACAMFGVSRMTWFDWAQRRQIRCGRLFPMPAGGRCMLYPIEELTRLREELSRLTKPYPDPERLRCFRVPLKGYLCYREAVIDAESLPLVEGRDWHWEPGGDGGRGAVALATSTGSNTALCRIVAGIAADAEARIMHRNGDPLDCRRENLIVRTVQQQIWGNRKITMRAGHPCTSHYKGVCWDRRKGKWLAQIKKAGHHRHIGRFGDEIAAAEAYDRAARDLFGEHARLNFPDGADADCERPRTAA